MSAIHIDTGDYSLLGRLYGGDRTGPGPAVLFLRGWSPGMPWSDMELHAWLCARKLGIACLAVEFRGMGSPGDAGKLSRADFLNDVLASYDYIRGLKGVDGRRIFAVGESFGAYMASVLSARRELKGILLRVPTDFPNEGFEGNPQILYAVNRTREWKLGKHEPHESHALDAVSRFQGDILIVESGRDEIVPHQTVENYLSAASGRAAHVLMEKAGHGLISPPQMRKFYQLETQWLREHM